MEAEEKERWSFNLSALYYQFSLFVMWNAVFQKYLSGWKCALFVYIVITKQNEHDIGALLNRAYPKNSIWIDGQYVRLAEQRTTMPTIQNGHSAYDVYLLLSHSFIRWQTFTRQIRTDVCPIFNYYGGSTDSYLPLFCLWPRSKISIQSPGKNVWTKSYLILLIVA